MAIIYDEIDSSDTQTSISFPGDQGFSSKDLSDKDLKMSEKLKLTKRDVEVGTLEKADKVLSDKLNTLQKNRTKRKSIVVDVLQQSGPCDACDLRFKRFVKKWTEKLVESRYVDEFTLNVYYETKPIVKYCKGRDWMESVETGKRFEVQYGQIEKHWISHQIEVVQCLSKVIHHQMKNLKSLLANSSKAKEIKRGETLLPELERGLLPRKD